MKKEMTKKEIKIYMKGQLESMWEHIRTLRHMIVNIENQETKSENDERLLEMLKQDKYQEVSKATDLENLFIKFFGENMYGEKVDA